MRSFGRNVRMLMKPIVYL